MSEFEVCGLLDDLAAKILMSPSGGAELRHIRMHPQIYDRMAEAKSRELERGNPLLVFGMDAIRAEDVAPDRPEMS